MAKYFATLMLVGAVVLTMGGTSYGAPLNDEHRNSQNPGPESLNVVVQWNRTRPADS